MQPFEYVEANSIEDAVALLAAQPGSAHPVAGGTDLLSEIKEGVVKPRRLVSLGAIPGLRGISQTPDGLSIGAMTTIAEVAAHPAIGRDYPALAQAAAGLATPQIRNVGTLGGNLNQRPRCWYYRHPAMVCLKKGGDHCYALAGNSKYLCITGGDRCYIVHPSDTAVALTALDATVEIAGPKALRRLPMEEYFVGPGQDIAGETVLAPGELVTRVFLPTSQGQPPGSGAPARTADGPQSGGEATKSLYLKAREREAGDFALVSVAAIVHLDGAAIRHASLVLGGVAPVPYRARMVEDYLRGRAPAEVDPVHAGSLAVPDARPMADNGYKVILAANLVKQAVQQLLSPSNP